MLAEFSVIQGEYLRDILDQPRALEETLASLTELKPLRVVASRVDSGKFDRIVLTGMGSSFHALHPLYLDLIDRGITSVMVETSELVHYQTRLFDPKTLIIAVSQSGQSAEVVRLLKANRGKSRLVAVTNTQKSPLAKEADGVIVTRAGREFSVSCKTFVTGLMALKWLGDIFGGGNLRETREELETVCSAVRSYLNDWKDHTEKFAQRLTGIRHLFFVGRGSSLAAVEMGALIVKEADHFPAEGMSCAGFRHGPFEMLSKDTFVLVFAGAEKTRDLNLRLLGDIREQSGRAELVSEGGHFEPCILPKVPEAVRPIVEALPVQMITLALAAQAGREPGRFQLATKITTTE
ncbi:MAG: hypothetical protein DMG69_25135 [Acidobacteria bacterium]|nr:MAG: hypothetical protein DMG69_25135 [Acidobacteriota bacterium]